MQKSSREKIALVVFIALAVLGLCGLCWYLFAGHSWNVAASTIDDTVGEMDGYTAIVYEGTAVPEPEGKGEERETGLLLLSSDDKDEPVDIAALRQDYRDKGAHVLELDTVNPERYREGSILKCESKRIGVMYAGTDTTQLEVAQCMESFSDASVDFSVVITPDRWKVQRITGIDIVIFTENEDLIASGQTQDGTFYVDAPEKGNAGVVLISPSNVVSAKEVDEF